MLLVIRVNGIVACEEVHSEDEAEEVMKPYRRHAEHSYPLKEFSFVLYEALEIKRYTINGAD